MWERSGGGLRASAGGVVRRTVDGAEQVVVVHRPRYDDWVLPKGTPEDGEGWEGTAVREVREETGIDATIVGVAGSIAYEADGATEVAVFFEMRCDGEGAPRRPDDEVDRVEWLGPGQAVARLSYPNEQRVLRSSFDLRQPRRRRRLAPGPARSLRQRRLDTELAIQAEVLRKSMAEAEAAGRDTSWVGAAERLLAQARRAAAGGEVDRGWQALHAALRLRYGGSDVDELKVRADALQREAERKLDGWRRRTVVDLLAGPPGGETDADRRALAARVAAAQEVMDGHAANTYILIETLQQRLRKLLLFLALLLAAVLVVGPEVADAPDALASRWRTGLLMVLGALGAVLSMASASLRRGFSERVFEVIGPDWTALVRLAVGAASALVVAVILESDLIGSVDVEDAGVYPFAVAAGFTERLVSRMIATVDPASGRGQG